MTIETSLSVGDNIHFIENRKAVQSVVRKIAIDVNQDKSLSITYICNADTEGRTGLKVSEGDGFKSKEELIKSL